MSRVNARRVAAAAAMVMASEALRRAMDYVLVADPSPALTAKADRLSAVALDFALTAAQEWGLGLVHRGATTGDSDV